MALRLCWLWFQWTDPQRAWVGFDIPCDDKDKDLFYAATTITMGDGGLMSFWYAPWLQGQKPKDIAPGIFAISKRTKSSVSKALEDNDWVRRIDMQEGLTVDLIQQFFNLWVKVQEVQLVVRTKDAIQWKFTADGCYSAATAYRMQFA